MLSAIDSPKSKTITIAFMGLKSMLLGLFLCLSFWQLDVETQCSDSLVQSVLVFKLIFILGALMYLFLVFYFLCTSGFDRNEYYVMFALHLAAMVGVTIIGLIQSMKGNDCEVKHTFLGVSISIFIVFVASAVFIMAVSLYFALKFAHFGSNVVWTFLWLQGWYCGNAIIAVIGFIHGVMSLLGLICFVVLNFKGKNKMSADLWRKLYILSVVLMIFCYVINFIGDATSGECKSAHLFALTYEKFGIFEMISPILLLIFMNTEMGDPRETLIKSQANVFIKRRQNAEFIIDDQN